MPARYPPIAPRGPISADVPTNAPARIEDINNLESRPDEGEYIAQLAALARDKRRFLVAHHPIKDALHMALQQPAGVLLQRYAATLRAFQEANAAALPSDEPGETQAGTGADVDMRPAIVAFIETQVAKALLGDLQAAALISDRIEGKAGLRKADLDAETQAQRTRIRGVITDLVETMVERRAGRATVIEGEATSDDE
jgi:hypothetical protein